MDAMQPPSGGGGRKLGCFVGALALLLLVGTPVGFGVFKTYVDLHG